MFLKAGSKLTRFARKKFAFAARRPNPLGHSSCSVAGLARVQAETNPRVSLRSLATPATMWRCEPSQGK